VNTRIKCAVDGMVVVPCKALEDSAMGTNPEDGMEGIWRWERASITTPDLLMALYGAQSGMFIEHGIMFNFCPFCGERIDAPFTGNQE